MSKKCIGCGVSLQDSDIKKIGYTPKIDGTYCQRCYRLTNYDDLTLYVKQGESDSEIYAQINKLDCLVCYVVDLFDFNGSMIEGLNRHIGNKDVLLIGTKRDLLPQTLSNNKLLSWIRSEIKHKFNICGICISAYKGQDGIDNIIEAIKQLSKGRPVVFMGCANVGKSTLINALLNKDTITTSRYPGTTVDMIEFDSVVGKVYDTPGVMRQDNIIHYLDLKELKNVIPMTALKPRVFQLYEPQTISIGGIVRIDFIKGVNTIVTGYFNDKVNMHRGKYEKADTLWNTQYNAILVPTLKGVKSFDEFTRMEYVIDSDKKQDIMINGFGWVCISSKEKQVIVVYLPKMIGINKTNARV